jgi:hypothetical protein
LRHLSTVLTNMHFHPFWVDLLYLWAILSVLVILAASLKKPRAFKNALAGLAISICLPLLIAVIIVAMPFAISHKRKKKKAETDKKTPGHPFTTMAGRPGAIIKKYLYPDRHESK